MKNTSLTIEEISVLLGYSNHSNFYKAFKEYYQMTPREYLNETLVNLTDCIKENKYEFTDDCIGIISPTYNWGLPSIVKEFLERTEFHKCPVNAIEMKNKRPVWVKEKCVMCLGCLHRCPKFAIEYGKNTTKHGQYTHPNVKV